MKFDLEERVIKFAVDVLNFVETMPDTKSANHLCGQLIRSATAPALNYGEANACESKSDFIHKMGIALKELRETWVCLRLIQLRFFKTDARVNSLLEENRQLILIFGASINTARANLNSKT